MPQVLAEARAALGCPNLTAVPLEDEGGEGTVGSHWEFRLFQDDYMVGQTSGYTQQVTRLTMALMQDR